MGEQRAEGKREGGTLVCKSLVVFPLMIAIQGLLKDTSKR